MGRDAGHRGADGDAHETGLGDRRVDDPAGSELLDQARQDLERRARLGDVLADHEDGRVAPHLLGDRLVDRLGQRDLTHHDAPA